MSWKIMPGLVLALSLAVAGNIYASEGSARDLPVIESHVITLSSKPGSEKQILIPQKILISRDEIPGVFVLENNEARFRMVLPGKRVGNNVEILSGLFGDEKILSDRLDSMHDGSPVKVIR